MAARWWTSISICLILLSFIVFGYMSRRPLCIDSKLVEKIDRISEAGEVATAYRCGMYKAVPYDEQWNNSLASISRRVQRTEKFLESLAPISGYFHVLVFEKKPWTYKIVGRDIHLSEEALYAPGALEKSLIKAWLREKSNPQMQEHPILEESLSDLLFYANQGDLQIEDPQLKISPDIESIEKWPFVVKSLSGYCRSSWRELEHQQVCLKELKDKQSFEAKDVNLISLSLRPLLTQAMVASYMKLRPNEQRFFLASIPRVIASINIQYPPGGFSAIDSSKQSLIDLSLEVSGLLKALIEDQDLTSDSDLRYSTAFSRWTAFLGSEMLLRGFSDQLGEAKLDHLVAIIRAKSDLQMEALARAALKLKSLTVALLDHDQIYLLPGIDPVQRGLFGKIVAQRVSVIACGALTLSELDSYSDITDRLTVVESCDDSPSLQYEGLMLGQIDKFALQNPTVSFVEVHLPSLHLLLERQKVSPSLNLAMSFDQASLLQALGWQKPVYDESLKAYHAKSAIEAFKLYRPKYKIN
jgi:hypothetical protein